VRNYASHWRIQAKPAGIANASVTHRKRAIKPRPVSKHLPFRPVIKVMWSSSSLRNRISSTLAVGDRRCPGWAKVRELSMGLSIARFIRDDSGATAIEYGLLAAGIAVAIIATVFALGTDLNTTFSTVSNGLN
jgi:pilus assembly protein Flp/PilA